MWLESGETVAEKALIIIDQRKPPLQATIALALRLLGGLFAPNKTQGLAGCPQQATST